MKIKIKLNIGGIFKIMMPLMSHLLQIFYSIISPVGNTAMH